LVCENFADHVWVASYGAIYWVSDAFELEFTWVSKLFSFQICVLLSILMPEIIFSRYKTDFLDLYFLHDGSFVKMNALDGSLRTETEVENIALKRWG
jgi:hypothetical protein